MKKLWVCKSLDKRTKTEFKIYYSNLNRVIYIKLCIFLIIIDQFYKYIEYFKINFNNTYNLK